MRKDPKFGGGAGGTCEVTKNQTQHSPRVEFWVVTVAEVEAPSRSSGRHSKVYTIKLTENWCDCGEFQSLRLPCSHAIVTCSTLNFDCGQFISPIYRLDNILKVYGLEF
ncbi:hypothetical protein Lal_00042638 [Lupinus albus]|nr:hypothetical protein Lal_00042638 [Lupinus albus]